MIAPHHVISVPLTSPDATAATKLRAALDEVCAHSDVYDPALTRMTRGQAQHAMVFSHYERVSHGPPPGDGPIAPAAALRG